MLEYKLYPHTGLEAHRRSESGLLHQKSSTGTILVYEDVWTSLAYIAIFLSFVRKDGLLNVFWVKSFT